MGVSLKAATQSCAPFRAHPSLQLPAAFEFQAPARLERNWEEKIVVKISESDPGFSEIYRPWRIRHPKFLSDLKRYEWLNCLSYYVKMRTLRTDQSDWTAIVDQAPSQILYPRNVMDVLKVADQIPEAFKIRRTKAEVIQGNIFSKYHILALDHTDLQSDFVLSNLLFLLDEGFGEKLLRAVPSFRYFYAFKGHEVRSNIAAFHRQMKAISVGGLTNYPRMNYSWKDRTTVLSALAHEIGHAFLFDQITPAELLELGGRFGNWTMPAQDQNLFLTFYSAIFFETNPRMKEIDRLFLGSNEPRLAEFKNLTSQYAANNLHEWFADSFAAYILTKLGRANKLSPDWKRNLMEPQDPRQGHYWVDYNNLSPEFFTWFENKVVNLNHVENSSAMGSRIAFEVPGPSQQKNATTF